MGKLLSIEDILDRKDFKRKTVQVPEWGGDIILQELDGDEAMKYTQIKQGQQGMVRLVWLSCVHEDGSRLFTNPAQLEKLGKKGFSTLSRLQDECLELNGLRMKRITVEEEKAKMLKEQLDTLIAKGGANVEELKTLLEIVSPPDEETQAKNA